MNLNQGKRNKQAVQVLNKVEYDSEGNPIGMMEDPSNPASANFGTPREPRRGGCYRGDGSAYITITGLLSTDTVEVFDGSDMPTISNGRLDIASGDRIFGVRIFRAGELWAKYNCSENSGNICYDSSGNGNHGQIINAITTTPEENPNSIHQYQDVYSFENEEGYSNNGSFDISRTQGMGRGAGALDVGTRYLKLDDSVNAAYSAWFKFYDLQYNENIYWHSGNAWVFRSGYIYRISIRVSEVSKGSFSLQLGRTSTNRSVDISTNGEYVLDIECFPTGYAEYLYVIQNYCDARIELLNVEELGSKGIFLPKNSSITLPPFKDVLDNNLQYIGKVPGKAKFVNSSCFQGDGVLGGPYADMLNSITLAGDFSIEFSFVRTGPKLWNSVMGNSALTTNGSIYVWYKSSLLNFSEIRIEIRLSGVTTSIYTMSTDSLPSTIGQVHRVLLVRVGTQLSCRVDGIYYTNTVTNTDILSSALSVNRLFFGANPTEYRPKGLIWDIKVTSAGVTIAHWPLCEPITDPSNHTYHDVSGNGNHATLVNGTLANNGKQDKFHYLQRGFSFKSYKLSYSSRAEISLNLDTSKKYDITMWVKMNLGSNDDCYLLDTRNSLSGGRYAHLLASNISTNLVRDSIRVDNVVTLTIPRDGQYHKVEILGIQFPYSDTVLTLFNRYAYGLEMHYFAYAEVSDSDGNKILSHLDIVSALNQSTIVYNEGILVPKNHPNEKDVIGTDLDFPQDSHSFLNTGTELEAYDYPALKQADKDNNFWYIGDVGVRRVSHYELAIENLMSDKIFLDTTNKNI